MKGDCVLLQQLTESLHVSVNVLLFVVCCVQGQCVCYGMSTYLCFYMCVCVRPSWFYFRRRRFPQTVLSSIHSVLLNVTLLLASGDDSMLSWLVDLCHLVLALRG